MHLASTSPPLYHCSSLPLLRQSPDHIPHRARIILCATALRKDRTSAHRLGAPTPLKRYEGSTVSEKFSMAAADPASLPRGEPLCPPQQSSCVDARPIPLAGFYPQAFLTVWPCHAMAFSSRFLVDECRACECVCASAH
ncbi:unnamed protein product [Caenorhabditis auriculariae]|uniref:Uncharacterized protein n=1 Tax=Caenorhabditis auriculariae TaxID=2777116 RepID=A0A8S1HS69_9PELO|nr:unnamed protein product [Caenorhabditis auriculariae]